MAHFAELDENNIVLRIVHVPEEHALWAQDYLANDMGYNGRWVQTTSNKKLWKAFAQPGYIWVEGPDLFVAPQPHKNWVLNSNWDWVPPSKHAYGQRLSTNGFSLN